MIINMVEQAKNLIAEKLKQLGNPKIAFVGQRCSDVLIFKDIVTVDLVICLDFGKDAEILSKQFEIISLEKEIGIRKNWYSPQIAEIFNNEKLKQQIIETLPKGSLIIPYSNSKELEDFASNNGYEILASPSCIREQLENKLNVFALKQKLCLHNQSVMCKLSEVKKQGFKGKLVVQLAKGSSGSGTCILDSVGEAEGLSEKLKGENDPLVVLTPFISGPTISVNGVITKKQNIFLAPSIQVVGNPETSTEPAVFCGVDFSFGKKLGDKDGLKSLLEKLGNELREMGFLGAFNVNIMKNGLVLTDINPRFMGSGQLTTAIQQQKGEIPIAAIHLLVMLGIDFEIDLQKVSKIAFMKSGGLIVLHSLENVNKRVSGELGLGIYKNINGRIEFLKESFDITGLGEKEVLVCGAIPQKGKVVAPKSPLLRIYTKGKVLDEESLKLNSEFKEIVKTLYCNLDPA